MERERKPLDAGAQRSTDLASNAQHISNDGAAQDTSSECNNQSRKSEDVIVICETEAQADAVRCHGFQACIVNQFSITDSRKPFFLTQDLLKSWVDRKDPLRIRTYNSEINVCKRSVRYQLLSQYPLELTGRKQWCVWRLEERKDRNGKVQLDEHGLPKKTKVPYGHITTTPESYERVFTYCRFSNHSAGCFHFMRPAIFV